MSNGGSNAPRPNKNERRDAAREKSRLLREQQQKRERRNRLLLWSGIALGAVAIIGIVALIIVNSIRPPAPGPANMASDGLKIGQNFEAVRTAALQPEATPVANEPNEAGVVDIQLYVDYLCPYCGDFEATNAEQIGALVEEGAATLEVHPIAILTSQSLGTQYSVRSANAAACVADSAPDSFYAFHNSLFENQPEEGTEGLDDATLISLAADAGASGEVVEKCINDNEFKSWVLAATERALAGPLPGANIAAVTGTPTVLVNGVQYTGGLDSAEEFSSFLLSQSANENATPTPTPTPSATE